ncbi:hypothetical protein [Dactylosporangium sp. CS-033363]|uniref:hypothetical protein n=1 Tax=Dactylosporangium sp. CS-033363 TaxID=3239935 RepID=UPI003D9460BF
MSQLLFHTPTGQAALAGAEFHHLRDVGEQPGTDAWGLDRTGTAVQRARALLALAPPEANGGTGYVFRDLEAAAGEHGTDTARRRLVSSLALVLRVHGLTLQIAGHWLKTANLELNTALVTGPDPLRLAAKLGGWGEQHAWVDGPDRAWLAGIIDDALTAGIYRRSLRIQPRGHGPVEDVDLGWGDVLQLLRARDDEPVVTSYTVTGRFPNAEMAAWSPSPMPDGWAPPWLDAPDRDDWLRTHPDRDERLQWYEEETRDGWYLLPDAEQWAQGMAGLRAQRPWAQLTPDNLAETTFGAGVTVYDVFAPDRDERVAAAFAEVG